MMKKSSVFIILLISLSFSLFAGNWLDIGPDARSMSLGGTGLTIANDVYAPYWNPALLPNKIVAGSTFATLLTEVNYTYLGYTQPFSFGRLGFAYLSSGMDGFKKTEYINERPFDLGDSFDAVDIALLVSYANNFAAVLKSADMIDESDANGWLKDVEVGTTIKVLSQELDDETASGIGLDLGFTYQYDKSLLIGSTIYNLLPPSMAWSTGTNIDFSTKMKLGFAYNIIDSFRLLADVDVFGFDVGGVHVGGEYLFNEYLKLRLGYDKNAWGLGVGVAYSGFNLDFSYNKAPEDEELDDSTRISIGIVLSDFSKKELVKEKVVEKEKTPPVVAKKEDKPIIKSKPKVEYEYDREPEEEIIPAELAEVEVEVPDVTNKEKIGIRGKVYHTKALLLNGKRVYIKPNGLFYIKKNLNYGINTFTFKAYNFDKKATKVVKKIKRLRPVSIVPKIEINLPEVSKEGKVGLRGRAFNTKTLLINGERVYVRPDGLFYLKKELKKGQNVISIKAYSRSKDMTRVTKKIKYL